MIQRRRFLAGTAALAALNITPLPLRAQTGARFARILVGTPPGSQLDVVARIIADHMRAASGQTYIVENRPGATGRIAIQQLIASEPDGNTLMIVPSGWLTTVPHTVKGLPYDPLKDFAPLAKVCSFAFAFAASSATPARSLGEFVSWCKANPAQASFAVPIPGGTLEFLGSLFAKSAGIAFTVVPYKGGGGEFRRDLIGGRIAAGLALVSEFNADHKAGRLRILAVTGATRSAELPEIPTFTELGYRDVVAKEWFGFIAPRRTPGEAIERLAGSIRSAVQSQPAREAFVRLGLEPTFTAGQEFADEIRLEFDKWGRIVKMIGFTPAD